MCLFLKWIHYDGSSGVARVELCQKLALSKHLERRGEDIARCGGFAKIMPRKYGTCDKAGGCVGEAPLGG